LFKKISSIASANILSSIFSFFFISLIVNKLEKSDFGIISILIIYSQIITLFGNFSLDNGLLRFYNNCVHKAKFVSTIFIFSFCSLVLVGIIFYAYIFIKKEVLFNEMSRFYFVILLSLFTIFNNLLKAIYLSEQDEKTYIIFTLISVVIPYSTSYAFIYFSNNHLDGYFLGYILGSLLVLLYALFSGVKFVKIDNIVFKREMIFEPIKFSILIIPGLLSSWIISSFDKIFLSNMNMNNLIAEVNLVNKVVSIATLPSLAIISAFYPYYLKLKNEEVHSLKIIKSVYFILFIISLGFTFFTLFCSEILLTFFHLYSNAVHILYFYSLSGYVSVITGFLNFEYYHQKKTGIVSLFIGLSAFVNIILIYILIPKFSEKIIGVISLTTSLLNFLLLYIYCSNFSYVIRNIRYKLSVLIIFFGCLNFIAFHSNFTLKILIFIFILIGTLFYFKKTNLDWRQFLS